MKVGFDLYCCANLEPEDNLLVATANIEGIRWEYGWTTPDWSGEKVITISHQTGLVWWEYLGLTRLVWLEGEG